MTSIESFGRTLVVAPHPDDEVLGAGGTIARLAEMGAEVTVAIVTSGRPPSYSPEAVAQVQEEAKAAHRLLGVNKTLFLGLPAAQLTEVSTVTLNGAIRTAVTDCDPETLLLPFVGDVHADHQRVFQAGLVAARPHQMRYPRAILAYETLSETNWNAPYLTPGFLPNVFIEIGSQLDRKLEAMSRFASQLRDAPHERSLEAVRSLSVLRGATVHRSAAEAFVLLRQVI